MKVVKSADALKRLALASGASASLGGVRFNSASDTVTADRPVKPEPIVIEVTHPPVQDNTALLTKIVELLARPAPEIKIPEIRIPDIVMPEIRMPDIVMPDIVMPEIKIPEIKMPDLQWPPAVEPAPKISWVFKVERDVRGFMTQIVATSKSS